MSTQNFTNDEIKSIKQIFNQFDKNNNGSIDKKELNTLSIALNNPLSSAELHSFMIEFDKDNSSSISWEEFIEYWGSM